MDGISRKEEGMMTSEPTGSKIIVYPYRWVVIAVFAGINVVVQMQWLSFAPIAKAAQAVYGVSALQVDFFSIIYLAVFVIICIPASFVVDTFGIRVGISIGAALAGVFGLMKGIFAADYTMVCIAQTGLALSQPFIINSTTKVAVQWFPITERATAGGIGLLAQFLGMIVAMIVTPHLISIDAEGGYSISEMLMTYGIITAGAAVILLVFLKEKPPTPPCLEGQDERFKVFEGLRHMLKNRDMLLLIMVFFLGLGMFNAITTCIDQICKLRDLNFEQSGLVGGMMLISGVLGSIAFPMISDKLRKRKAVFLFTGICSIPGLIGLTVASHYWGMLISAFGMGFFFLGGAPVLFQFSAEINAPAPESTSQGLLMLAGQIGGILFVIGMNSLGMIPSMYVFIVFGCMNAILFLLMRESKMIQSVQTTAMAAQARS
jgi:MFS family permease